MNLSRVSPAALLVAAGALTLGACGNGETGSGDQPDYAASSDGISTVAKAERQPTNDVKGETLEGKQLDVADFKGKIIVINVWGSWCPPCRAETPNFVKVAKETKAKGVEFLGINTRDANRRQAIAFETDYSVRYPSLYDPTGKVVLHGFPKGTLNPQTVPSTIVLDRDGKIAARSLRPLSEENLRKMISPLLAEK
ncbi:TlpA family protein disulfide reductase [Streptomyces sp. NBC_00258]|uniref:TlpA family protein disulfide reductase n=1 Tax=Streptomyces sp. NBC_00258 TaxID=2903642 RepID=UPI002E2A85A4|nr:TlpA disulfide reductase family protein [Streptomyces sp. NBC_00258]